MSFKVKEKENKLISNINEIDIKFREALPKIIQSYSNFFRVNKKVDIYSGDECIPFEQRHPTFKSLMKLEFQNALREFKRK